MTGKIVELDFEQELYKYFGQVKDFTLGMRIAKRFYQMGTEQKESVSEDLEEAADKYADKHPTCGLARHSFKAGAKWQKEQLLAKAVDALVHTFDNGYIRVGTQLLANNKYGLKVGDKVKVIIVKED